MHQAHVGRGGWLRARAGSTRTAGLAVAAVLSVAFAGLVVFYAMRGPRVSNAGLDGQEAPPPPDIKDIAKAAGNSGAFEVAGGKDQRVTFTDRNDPTRVAGELGWNRLEPLEGKRYRLQQPRSFNYMKDGRIVYVRADEGMFVIPRQDQEPQSGTLSGNVEIRLYPAMPPGTKVDPEKGVPLLTARMASVDFDTTTGELRTSSRVVGEGQFGEFAFTGLHVVTNQTDRRVELMEIDRGEKIVLKPRNMRSGDGVGAPGKSKPGTNEGGSVADATSSAPAAPPSARPATNPGATPAPAPLDEVFYAAAFSEDVKVVQGAKEISSDRLRTWTHLIDGKLAPGATGDLEKLADSPSSKSADKDPEKQAATPAATDAQPAAVPESATPAETAPGSVGTPPAPGVAPALSQTATTTPAPTAAPSAQPADSLAAVRSDEDVTITWTGPLVLKAEKDRPGELAKDEVSLRFESDLPGGTRFSATDQKASGSATNVEYFATTRRVGLLGDDTTPAVVRSQGAGRVEARSVMIGVATGVVDIPSGGVLVQDKSKADAEAAEAIARRVAWGESAQFLFDTRDGQMTGALREAFLHGKVDAQDGRGTLNGGYLHATFIPSPRTDGQAVLRRIEVRDGATGNDGRGASLAAGELDLSFVPIRKGNAGIGESEPREFEARGGVHVERDGVTLDADKLRAGLASKSDSGPKKNDIEVTDVKADGTVRFTRRDGVVANADQLRADAVAQVVELMGDHVSLSKGASAVSGTSMVLKGAERSLEVFGAGVFEHSPAAKQAVEVAAGDGDVANPAKDLGHVLATWKGGMVFSDVSGVLDAAGDVQATYTPGPLEQDKLFGERLHLELTPADASGGESSSGIASLDLGTKSSEPAQVKKPDDRQLLLASVTGSDLERADGKRASVESRTYRLNEDASEGRELESLVYLEGSMIVGDNARGTMTVPSAGMLLSFDKRNTPPKVEVVGEEPTTARGTARVRWTNEMTYERVAGLATVRGGVKLDHAPIDSRDKAELESEKLVVRFRDAESFNERGMRMVRGQFLGATANGAVWARSMGKEITSDQLEYDAVARTIEAIASEGNLAQMFDPKNPTPVTARRIFWDLAKDRVEIKDAGTITVPR